MDEITFRSFRADWRAAGKSANTADQMIWSLRRVARRGLALPPDLELVDAREWLAERLSEVSVATAHQEARSLRVFSKFVAEEFSQPDKLAGLKLPKVPEPMPQRTADGPTVERLLASFREDETFEGVRDRALIATLWCSGIRREEAAKMQTRHLDLYDESVFLDHVKRKPTGSTSRTAPLAGAVRPLHRYLARRKDHPQADHPSLWLTRYGAMSKFGISQAIQRRGIDAGLNLSPHDLRRGTATQWKASGGSDSGLMAALGWESPTMLRRYTKLHEGKLAVDEAKRLRATREGLAQPPRRRAG